MSRSSPPVALISCIRNEGIHLLEWIAYHRVIGFDPIVICSNDCEDGSDHLLDRLALGGAVIHLPNPLGPGDRPILAGVERAMTHLRHGAVDWVAHLDSDEFLNIAPGAVPVQDLLDRIGDRAHAVALPWLSFGDSGQLTWPGETLRAFTSCEARIDPALVKFKSMFRLSAFAGASDHMPTAPIIAALRPVNAAGEPLSRAPLLGRPQSRYQPVADALRGGTVVNHYATRSRDVFLMKNLRGRGTGPASKKYHLNSPWHRRANRNDRQDISILRRWPEVAQELARLRALSGVSAAEAACRDWFHTTTARVLTPETIARWTVARASTQRPGHKDLDPKTRTPGPDPVTESPA